MSERVIFEGKKESIDQHFVAIVYSFCHVDALQRYLTQSKTEILYAIFLFVIRQSDISEVTFTF